MKTNKLCLLVYYYRNENNDDETNDAQLLEIQINDKMKMDRRLFLMQDIKVRQSYMKKIYDQLLGRRKMQMLCRNKGNIFYIITNYTCRKDSYE